ncbi:MAG: hypothetical protein JJ885_03890 [Muricauda sp.]|jgi:hypothetical protein|nr:hypothetical protein [Allomuricauda sp.]MBO6533591.1 hypothetical protein [Allomuricauda sp.]MBO6589001.1 hypothetical protein [Allomuricauda sp.]MBO6618626.1 hypothetical protein [Allomuricauda sp.]MBO6644539.1 hypothetical protein [Allomuricauda sp.]MBO6746439.1 hypothetical protein [Allomuricauda sp.]
MRYRYLVPVIALVLCLVSCKDSKNKKEVDTFGTDTFHTFSINGNYNIDVPNFMTGTTGLNEEASLQFQSLIKEAYLLVIDEPKADFEEVYRDLGQYDDSLSVIQNYRDARLQILSRTTQIIHKSANTSRLIHGLDAESVELDAKVNGMDNEISYFLTFINGGEKVYMVMGWTLKERKKEHKKTFKTIAESFRLID